MFTVKFFTSWSFLIQNSYWTAKYLSWPKFLDLSSLIFLSPQIQWQFQSSGQDFLSFSSMITEIVYIRQPQHFWEPIRSSSDKFSNQSSQSESASVVFVKTITNMFSVRRLKIQWRLKKSDVFSFSAFREGEAQI